MATSILGIIWSWEFVTRTHPLSSCPNKALYISSPVLGFKAPATLLIDFVKNVYPVHEAKPKKQSKIVNEANINFLFFFNSPTTSAKMNEMKKSPVVVASIKISLIL
jgi:hypothetical protein